MSVGSRRAERLGRVLRRPGLVLLITALALSACASSSAGGRRRPERTPRPPATQASTSSVPASTTTLAPGLVSGRISAIGDSVMLDYAAPLTHDLKGVVVDAAVGRQWASGVAEVDELRARDALGATVVIALGTNGPVSPASFEAMAAALRGVPTVVYVTVHVDKPWGASVNALLRSDVPRTKNGLLADWATLARDHPSWFYADGTHLPIGGPGAQALAELITRTVEKSAAVTRASATKRHRAP